MAMSENTQPETVDEQVQVEVPATEAVVVPEQIAEVTVEEPKVPTNEAVGNEDIVIGEDELQNIFNSLFPDEKKEEEDPFYAEKKEDDKVNFEEVANETQQKLEQEIAERSKITEEFETYKVAQLEEINKVKTELDSANKKISEQEETLKKSDELWGKVLSDPILEQLVKKKINGEEISLAPAVHQEILDEITALEGTIEASSSPKPSPIEESYESRLAKASKVISRI